ncbi:MAG: hypothetical protein COW89_06345 [Nitrospinae bacterium CG22_combo_CG10-13_8_21_14_all_47_10]|nr:MAG: hypothetical protein COW89_06345 [Nitrospinae bacterium CG22_combo_CG10-13_8_21_14_all_47_10]
MFHVKHPLSAEPPGINLIWQANVWGREKPRPTIICPKTHCYLFVAVPTVSRETIFLRTQFYIGSGLKLW